MFHVPTVTTNLAGFGMWVDTYFDKPGNGCLVLNRTDSNEKEVIAGMEEFIRKFMQMNPEEAAAASQKAWEISRIANWNTLFSYYSEAYRFALEKSEERRDQRGITPASSRLRKCR